MIINKIIKFIYTIIILNIFIASQALANSDFNLWLKDFKLKAINSGISEEIVNDVMADARFLPKVLEYDRYQQEFYEDTFTYIKKRSSNRKLKEGLKLYKKEN